MRPGVTMRKAGYAFLFLCWTRGGHTKFRVMTLVIPDC